MKKSLPRLAATLMGSLVATEKASDINTDNRWDDTLSNGEMRCWGNNEAGQLGNGRSNASSPELPGRVLGANGQGFLNVGTLTRTASPNADADADKVFTWAERTFPQYSGPAAPASTSVSGYRLRFYPDTSSYLGVNESGTPHLYYLGPLSSNTVMDLGLLTNWVVTAGQ